MIEDDPADVWLFRECLNGVADWCRLTVVSTGHEALDRLFGRTLNGGDILPDLILLDLNLPVMTGHEVLTVLKARRPFNEIPVIVLTTSQHPGDIQKAYDLGAACYVIKPCDLESFRNVCRSIREFWSLYATLPRLLHG